ncbi:hypothetical protein [Nocardia cyriacigeorgica]|uniref:WDGH domain-containing protein n=1 Tax=Nocardia cyriacigeorgica TaxID=135487 RepID=UPI002457B46D|nr:hypothetical protein [Nocardia cyriacigeorgica]
MPDQTPALLTDERLHQLVTDDIVCVPDWVRSIAAELLAARTQLAELEAAAPKITAETSDGHHTFAELYHYRMLYNAALFNEWAAQGRYDVHKSIRHADGELCFDGDWFVVYAQLPTGQISNHYEMTDWDRFRVPERDRAAEWDGHTPQQVAERLAAFLKLGPGGPRFSQRHLEQVTRERDAARARIAVLEAADRPAARCQETTVNPTNSEHPSCAWCVLPAGHQGMHRAELPHSHGGATLEWPNSAAPASGSDHA